MNRKNPTNERIKLVYFEFLRQADGKSEQTIRQHEKAISRYEDFTHRADFKIFGQKQATGFKEHLAQLGLAPATTLTTINILKRFFGWLAMQPGYKRAIALSDIEYLNLSEKNIRAATAPVDRPFPMLQMVERVIEAMPGERAIEKRDRALIVFTAITGIRDGALVSLKLKHFDPRRMLVLQNPLEVSTKFGKRIDTFLFPMNNVFEALFIDYVRHLREVQLFGDHDPLFPKTAMGQDENQCFVPTGLSREHWADASPIREIFKTAFSAAGLDAFTPNSFRQMIVSEMYARELSVAEFKAWSQNLGHEGAMTTLTSYGKIGMEEQGRLVRNSGTLPIDDGEIEAVRELLKKLRR